MKRRTVDETVEVDVRSKTLGLEDVLPERKDPVVRAERHRAGEKCLHWRRLPNGAIGTMTEEVARRAPCRFCMGLGVLLGDLSIDRREHSGNWISAVDLKSMEEARRTARPRKVA